MRNMFITKGLLVGVIACAIIGWWLLPVPLTQAEDQTLGGPPLAVVSETTVGRGSEATKALRNPTLLPGNTPSASDTGCFATRGDVNHGGGSNSIDIADLTYLIDFFFRSGLQPVCPEEGDVDASGETDISDITFLVAYIFLGGPTPGDYIIYFRDGGYWNGYEDRYIAYHTATEQIDTMFTPYRSFRGINLSADGLRLYLSTFSVTNVLSSNSMSLITQLSYQSHGGVAVTSDNQLLAVLGVGGIFLLQASDYSLVFSDTDPTIRGIFSANNKRLYCISGDGHSPYYVYKLDIENAFAVTRKSFPGRSPIDVVPSPDESKWYIKSNIATFVSLFEVYDTIADSIIFSDTLIPGLGDIEVTPDGRFVFYSNPGSTLTGPPPPSHFKVYDVENNELYKVIRTDTLPSQWPGNFPIGNFAITPDGRKLIALRGVGGGEFVVVDVDQMEIVKYVNVGEIWLRNLTCQNGRKIMIQ